MISATVIIPTHNRRELVLDAVRHLLEQDFPADRIQIIVAADRCTDLTEEALAKEFGDSILVAQSAAPGSSGAINTGLAAAEGEIAIIIDDEMQASPGFVRAHVRAHEVNPGELVVVTGYSPVVAGDAADPLKRYIARGYERYHAELDRPRRRSAPTDLNSGNMSIPVQALRDAGGFNESYFFQRNDFELATRLIERGFHIAYCRDAVAEQHLGLNGATIVDRAKPRAVNDVRLAREHPWCVPSLNFYANISSSNGRLKWRLAWMTRGVVSRALRLARRGLPDNLFLVRHTYAWTYAVEVVKASGGWAGFDRLTSKAGAWQSRRP